MTAVTAAREKTYILDNLRAIAEWTSYTPTVTQSGSVTKTVTYAKYRTFGGTTEVIVYLSLTGSGTTNNAITVSLPTTCVTSTTLSVGSGFYLDSGTATYPIGVLIASTTTVNFLRQDTQPGNSFGQDPNFAAASGDVLRFHCVYENA